MVYTRDLKSLAFAGLRVRVPSLVLKTSFLTQKRGFFIFRVQLRVHWVLVTLRMAAENYNFLALPFIFETLRF
jgi:hypothetical protein